MAVYDKLWTLRRLATPGHRRLVNRVVARLLAKPYGWAQDVIGFQLHPKTPFGSKPILPHGVAGIYIAKSAKVGRDCVIFQQAMIVANQLAGSRGIGAPTVGDRCYIGTGAKIIGGVTIGNDVRIGANATVTRDVPDNATVVGTNVIKLSGTPNDNRYYFVSRLGWSYLRDGDLIAADPEVAAHLEMGFKRP